MDLLQTFMKCMYPGSIRTESIESIDHDYPNCRFQVSNIDERGEEVSRGELQISDKDLIYFRPKRFPVRWPIDYIRRYGCSEQGDIFSFEAGRRCPTGEAIFAFRLSRGPELAELLKERMEKSSETITPNQISNDLTANEKPSITGHLRGADPRPLSYALIDFDTTKALSESAQAHAKRI